MHPTIVETFKSVCLLIFLTYSLNILIQINFLNEQSTDPGGNDSESNRWIVAAGSILREFEAELVLATKQDGYDGGYDTDEDGINNQHVRWSFSGALLFSITVITTIGAYYLVRTYT